MAAKRSKKGALKPKMPKRIFAQASTLSIGNTSLFNTAGMGFDGSVDAFQSDPAVTNRAVCMLSKAGFEVLQVTPYTINIAGSQALYEKTFQTELEIVQREVIKPGGIEDLAEFVECPETDIDGLVNTDRSDLAEVLEGVAIEEPRYFMAGPSPLPPNKEYWHLRVPAGISLGANADRAHRVGITGKGIKVSMVDSGHYRHPFFTQRGYRVAPVVLGPAASDPTKDEHGHGTGESANLFAVAPDAELLPVKINFVNSIGAFNKAVALRPDIITCSWGSSRKNPPLSAADQVLAVAVAAAWNDGIIVVFSAGNGHFGFPGQHPDVISAGGVFRDVDDALRASDYASGFMSNLYPGRLVPDVCGLVGRQPGAAYIMLPVEPGCKIDREGAGGPHPPRDETRQNDGWAAFSGTSAAAPQLAGAAALIKQACGGLRPDQVRSILKRTAVDVKAGNCNPVCSPPSGNPATAGVDRATGHGLVNAQKAVLLAKLHCLVIREPVRGQPPDSGRTRPPHLPRPPEPVRRPEPVSPPIASSNTESWSVDPCGEVDATGETSLEALYRRGMSLTEEDVEAIEQMIIGSEMDDLDGDE